MAGLTRRCTGIPSGAIPAQDGFGRLALWPTANPAFPFFFLNSPASRHAQRLANKARRINGHGVTQTSTIYHCHVAQGYLSNSSAALANPSLDKQEIACHRPMHNPRIIDQAIQSMLA
jgi:hypothetical protein